MGGPQVEPIRAGAGNGTQVHRRLTARHERGSTQRSVRLSGV